MVRRVTVAAVVMGVLIVVGTATLLVMVLGRRPATALAPAPVAVTGPVLLDEPPGTRIAAASGPAEALVLLLQGGGPDRVVTIDSRTGRMAGRVALAR